MPLRRPESRHAAESNLLLEFAVFPDLLSSITTFNLYRSAQPALRVAVKRGSDKVECRVWISFKRPLADLCQWSAKSEDCGSESSPQVSLLLC
jgi:hypothetical protein